MEKSLFLTDAQLKAELMRCEYCEERPCEDACPVNCSPVDFIMAARVGAPSDMARSAAKIMKNNPLGGVCGLVCPDRHCMAACSHKLLDGAINIPAVQATIVANAKKMKKMPTFTAAKSNGKKVAVVGGGPAGLAAAGVLAQKGYRVDIFEARKRLGGAADLIPPYRLPKKDLDSDIKFVLSLGNIKVKKGQAVKDPEKLLKRGYAAVVVAAGLWQPFKLGIAGEDLALSGLEYLDNPKRYKLKGTVAVVGGGAVAVDCAGTALRNGASKVEVFALEKPGEMPLTAKEMQEVIEDGFELSSRTRVASIDETKQGLTLDVIKVKLAARKKFNLADLRDVKGSLHARPGFSRVIIAIGSRAAMKKGKNKKVFYAGDMDCGPTTVVEAAAAGKNAAVQLDAALRRRPAVRVTNKVKSTVVLDGYVAKPVDLTADFFGRKIRSPFLLSAAPPSDGYEQMKLAYGAGWAGGIMKTAFCDVSVHIPGEYMHAFDDRTYGNCDNVSGHDLKRVGREIKRLVRAYPDRLTIGSTGGPVTGYDAADCRGWQTNTKLLEDAGAMGIEYSLSCPQGGDGTEGDIVSQNAALTAKIINWIMEASDKDVPKLFKLTGAVTSIVPIINAIKGVLAKYPDKKAGVTLANTFPTMIFRPGRKKSWDEGVIVGMSGEGVTPISLLNLANACPLGVAISGNGGPMDYKAAADFLALGVKTVQFCTIVMKYGYGIIDELENGISCLMQARGKKSMQELIGCALPGAVTDFMDLTPVKKISSCDHDLCLECGNCARCPYLAISMNKDNKPETDPAKCIGCSICVQKCFSGALSMRDRTKRELALLCEE